VLIVVDFRFSESYGDIVFVAAGVFTAVRCGRRRTGEFWASIGLVLALPAAFAVNIFSFFNPPGVQPLLVAPTIYGLALLALALLYPRRQSAPALEAPVGVPS